MCRGAKDCLHKLPGPLYHSYPEVGTGYCRLAACRVTGLLSLVRLSSKIKLDTYSIFDYCLTYDKTILAGRALLNLLECLDLIFNVI